MLASQVLQPGMTSLHFVFASRCRAPATPVVAAPGTAAEAAETAEAAACTEKSASSPSAAAARTAEADDIIRARPG